MIVALSKITAQMRLNHLIIYNILRNLIIMSCWYFISNTFNTFNYPVHCALLFLDWHYPSTFPLWNFALLTSIPFSWKILFILSKDFIYSSRRWYFGSLQLKCCSIADHASVKAKISSSSHSLLPLSPFCTGRLPFFFS